MRIVNEVVWTVEFASGQGVASSFAPWVVAAGAGGGDVPRTPAAAGPGG